MKSFSDDIPNVSTDEFKRASKVTDETNELVKANLAMMREFEEEVNEVCKRCNKKLTAIAIIAGLTLASVIAATAYFSFLGNL